MGRGDEPIDPGPLPPFAAFAAHRRAQAHRFEAAESALLTPRTVAGRRAAFRFGRSAAHAALQALGRDDGPILAGSHREPLWPSGVTGSISHTNELGVALVALLVDTDGVGIDIEARRPAPELNDQVPRAEERSWLDRAAPESRDDLLLALFSAKETIFKAFYPRVGTFFGFDAAALQPAAAGFDARLVTGLDPQYPPDRGFEIHCRWFGDLVLTWLILPRTRQTSAPVTPLGPGGG